MFDSILSDYFRPTIPFLAYPSTLYEELASSTYDWIPASVGPNSLLNVKLAKYSSTGKFLGLVDAVDAHMQLCGGGYSDGRSAFTFGAQYSKSVSNTPRQETDIGSMLSEQCSLSLVF